jgi:2-phosphosulfolactate phosphatase
VRHKGEKMNIKILHMVEGAKEATGIAVIIDVFRAFTVEAYIMNNGAEKLMPVGDMQIAYDYKEKDGNCVLIGERHGKILPGFDFGNSPSQIKNVDFTGRTVIHTTSAGTQGIDNAKNADEVLTGSLVNAKAIAEYIKQKKPETVSLVCMGLEAKSQTDEDNLCANYIKSLLEGKAPNLENEIEGLKKTSGAKFFDIAERDVFPEEDFYLSTEVDKFNFVLKVEKDDNGLNCVRRIDM